MTAGNAFPLSSNYQMLNTGQQLIHTYQERSSLFLTPSDHARVCLNFFFIASSLVLPLMELAEPLIGLDVISSNFIFRCGFGRGTVPAGIPGSTLHLSVPMRCPKEF